MTDLEDLCVYLSVRSDQDVSKTDLKLKLLSLGLKVAPDLSGANFVVYHNGSKETITKAKGRGHPVVNVRWLNACFDEKYLLPWKEFAMPEPGQSNLYRQILTKSNDDLPGNPERTSDDRNRISRPVDSVKHSSGSVPSEVEAKRNLWQYESLVGSGDQELTDIPQRIVTTIRSSGNPPAECQVDSNEEDGQYILVALSGIDKEALYPFIEEMGANYIENPYEIFCNKESADSLLNTDLNRTFQTSLSATSLLFASKIRLHTCKWSIDNTFLENCPAIPIRLKGCDGHLSETRNGYLVLVDTTGDENYRSAKHVLCYALGAPIVHQSWLLHCHMNKKVHDTLSFHTSSYHGNLKKRLKSFSRSQIAPSDRVKNHNRPQIFKGLQFYLWGEFSCPKRNEVALIIALAGGNVISKRPSKRKKSQARDMKRVDSNSCKVFVVFSEEDKRLSWHAQRYAPIHPK